MYFCYPCNARQTKQRNTKRTNLPLPGHSFLAAVLKYHAERVRGEPGTPQPQVAMSVKARFWQTAHPPHQNKGWQAGGVAYLQIKFLIHRLKNVYISIVCVGIIILKFCFVHQQHSSGNRICIYLMMSVILLSDICESSQSGNGPCLKPNK